MHPFRFVLAPLLLTLAGSLAPAEAQITIVDTDVIFPPSVVGGNPLVVNQPGGAGLTTLLFVAATSSLNLTNQVYASDLIGNPQLLLFVPYFTTIIQPDLTASFPTAPVTSSFSVTGFVVNFNFPIINASNLATVILEPPGGSCPGTPGHFQESGGLVVAEIESAPAVSAWAVESSLPGFTGSAYYRWNGSNHFGQPGVGTLTYPVEIYTPGTYRLKIHNRHNNPASDAENDCWVRVDGGPWEKFFSNAGITNAWNWAGGLEIGGTGQPADYFLGSGTHTIQLSARSFGYHIDRMHLYLPSVGNPLDLGYPESCVP